MNIYYLERTDDVGWGEPCSAIVVAKSWEEAMYTARDLSGYFYADRVQGQQVGITTQYCKDAYVLMVTDISGYY